MVMNMGKLSVHVVKWETQYQVKNGIRIVTKNCVQNVTGKTFYEENIAVFETMMVYQSI